MRQVVIFTTCTMPCHLFELKPQIWTETLKTSAIIWKSSWFEVAVRLYQIGLLDVAFIYL